MSFAPGLTIEQGQGKRERAKRRAMNILRQSTKPADAERLIREVKEIDYALMNLVGRTDCMTLAAAGDLVAMQRRLRKLRYQIESESKRVLLAPTAYG
jgi:hypothetical protein